MSFVALSNQKKERESLTLVKYLRNPCLKKSESMPFFITICQYECSVAMSILELMCVCRYKYICLSLAFFTILSFPQPVYYGEQCLSCFGLRMGQGIITFFLPVFHILKLLILLFSAIWDLKQNPRFTVVAFVSYLKELISVRLQL